MSELFSDENFTWKIENGEATLLKFFGGVTRVVVPSEIKGYPVTAIGERAFHGAWALFDIELPETLKRIGEAAFLACGTLKNLTFPKGLKTIEKDAFQGTGITSLVLPASLEFLGSGALYGIRVIEAEPGNPKFFTDANTLMERLDDGTVSIIRYYGDAASFFVPEGCSNIERGAFRGSKINKIAFPESLNILCEDVFIKCDDLRCCTFPIENSRIEVRFPEAGLPAKQSLWLVGCLRSTASCRYFDFDSYDSLMQEMPLSEEKIEIVTARLKNGYLLKPAFKKKYLKFLQDSADFSLGLAIKRNDLSKLNKFAELGIFTANNIDILIDCAADAPEFLSFLLNYKINNFGISETDYSL